MTGPYPAEAHASLAIDRGVDQEDDSSDRSRKTDEGPESQVVPECEAKHFPLEKQDASLEEGGVGPCKMHSRQGGEVVLQDRKSLIQTAKHALKLLPNRDESTAD